MEPFNIDIPASALDDLKKRLTRVRLPDASTEAGQAQGPSLDRATELMTYWRDRYDWRRFERQFNVLPQFMTKLDGMNVHVVNIRSSHPDALPLIMTHGWPGAVAEFFKVAPMLTQPERFGGSAADAFHLVLPSLPGFGFSEKPKMTGWGIPRIARAWALLMNQLGHDRYVAQGGDWGAGVATYMAAQQPKGLLGIHLNLPLVFPPPPAGEAGRTDAEQTAVAQLRRLGSDGGGYSKIQATRPQTLAYGLADSPVGQAMWIYEKIAEWSDCNGVPESIFSKDEMLDIITLYWLTNTSGSSARLYWESFQTDFRRIPVELPVAVSVFGGDKFQPPKLWGDQTYPNLMSWTTPPKGGHFAAWEQPNLFAHELRAAFRPFRSTPG